MPKITLAQLSAQLDLGNRVEGTGNRPGRNEREKLRAAAGSGKITARKPWEWDTSDAELPVVCQILQGGKPAHNWRTQIANAAAPAAVSLQPALTLPPLLPVAAPGSLHPSEQPPAPPQPSVDPHGSPAKRQRVVYEDHGASSAEFASEDQAGSAENANEDQAGSAENASEDEVAEPLASSSADAASPAAASSAAAPAGLVATACSSTLYRCRRGTELVGGRIEVWFEDDQRWYAGRVTNYSRRRGYQVNFDPVPGEDNLIMYITEDGDHEWRVEGETSRALVHSALQAEQTAPYFESEPATAHVPLLLLEPAAGVRASLEGAEEMIATMCNNEELEQLSSRLRVLLDAVLRRQGQLAPRVEVAPGLDHPD